MATEVIDQNIEGEAIPTASTERTVVLTAALGTAIAAFLPWAQFLGVSVIGIEGDGVLTLLLAIVILGLAYFRWGRRVAIATIGLGLLITVIGLLSLTGIASIGVYLTVLCGLVLSGAGVQSYRTL